MITGVTSVTHIGTKQDMSRWTRAHADSAGLNWSVHPGPGGTMVIVEHEADRSSLTADTAAAKVTRPAVPSVQAWMAS